MTLQVLIDALLVVGLLTAVSEWIRNRSHRSFKVCLYLGVIGLVRLSDLLLARIQFAADVHDALNFVLIVVMLFSLYQIVSLLFFRKS